MPYIVTTKRKCDSCWDGRPKWAGTMPAPPCGACGGSGESVSRRAVATLEEAQDHIYSVCAEGETDDEIIADEIDRMPEQGGTITLPDGTVIEVEQTMWADLIAEAAGASGVTEGMDAAETQQRILDAYNARQA
jgi:hypothetical protein